MFNTKNAVIRLRFLCVSFSIFDALIVSAWNISMMTIMMQPIFEFSLRIQCRKNVDNKRFRFSWSVWLCDECHPFLVSLPQGKYERYVFCTVPAYQVGSANGQSKWSSVLVLRLWPHHRHKNGYRIAFPADGSACENVECSIRNSQWWRKRRKCRAKWGKWLRIVFLTNGIYRARGKSAIAW